MTTPNRICIYPKDVMRITGKSERYGRMLLDKIKQKNAKEAHQFVTIKEFCSYTGIDFTETLAYLSL
jgi:hypothetical protein